MKKTKANGPADCVVSEMLQCLPVVTVYEVTHWFEKRFKGECPVPEAWNILRLVVSQEARCQSVETVARVPCDRTTECVLQVSGTQRFCWTCCTRRRSRLSGGACTWKPERGVNCEHIGALLTNILQRHWEWQEDRWTDLEPGYK